MINKRIKVRILMLLSMIPSLAIAADFHVSPAGDDSNPGTKSKPFKTIAHARDQVAKINAGMKEDITVYLGDGTYELSSPVVFDADDSGMNGHKVIYKPRKGEDMASAEVLATPGHPDSSSRFFRNGGRSCNVIRPTTNP